MKLRADVQPPGSRGGGSITLYGNGPQGVVALHAAALDKRITRVTIENTLIGYRRAMFQPLHRNVAMPSAGRAYEPGDLLAVAPAPVTIVNPVDAMGHLVTEAEARRELEYVFSGGLVRSMWRGARDPLPVD